MRVDRDSEATRLELESELLCSRFANPEGHPTEVKLLITRLSMYQPAFSPYEVAKAVVILKRR